MGRWICDFRPLNAVTKKRPTPIGDVFAKTRLLAGRRWKYLPFGVTNGPPYFQEMMLDLYGGSSRNLPNLLNNFMEDFEAYLDCFILTEFGITAAG